MICFLFFFAWDPHFGMNNPEHWSESMMVERIFGTPWADRPDGNSSHGRKEHFWNREAQGNTPKEYRDTQIFSESPPSQNTRSRFGRQPAVLSATYSKSYLRTHRNPKNTLRNSKKHEKTSKINKIRTSRKSGFSGSKQVSDHLGPDRTRQDQNPQTFQE